MLLRLPRSQEPHRGRALFLSCSVDGARDQQAILGALEDIDVTVFLAGEHRDRLPSDVALTEWNLTSMERCDVIGLWLVGDDSLLEVGLWAKSGKLVLGCSKGSATRALLEVACDRYSVALCAEIEEFVALLRKRLA